MENLSSSSAGSGIGSRTGAALDRMTASWLSMLSALPITCAVNTHRAGTREHTHPQQHTHSAHTQEHVVDHHYECSGRAAEGLSLSLSPVWLLRRWRASASSSSLPVSLSLSVCLFVSLPHRRHCWCFCCFCCWSRWSLLGCCVIVFVWNVCVCERAWQISRLILPLSSPTRRKKERVGLPPLCLSLSQLQSLCSLLHPPSTLSLPPQTMNLLLPQAPPTNTHTHTCSAVSNLTLDQLCVFSLVYNKQDLLLNM